jgi:N-acetylmuramoyl-L-alanine amidase
MALWTNDFIRVNEYTRPGFKLLGVRGIVMHYTATPGATARNEHDYFNGTAIEQKRYASAHIFVDKNEAICIIPLNEVAYHANEKPSRIAKFLASAPYYKDGNANLTTVSVEMCIEKDGSLHPATLERATNVVVELCRMFNLKETDIYRHYDITGKNCPAFWVSNPAGFEAFKAEVGKRLRGGSATYTTKAPTTVKAPQKVTPAQKISSAQTTAKPKFVLPNRILKLGDKGSDVLLLQKALIAANFYPDKNAPNGGADGVFGPKTQDALKRFQSVYANPADGIYGPRTRAALDKLLNH